MEKTVTIKCRDMIETLGLNSLSLDDKEDMIEKMSDIVSSRIILRVLERVNEAEAKEINGYVEAGDMDKLNVFLGSKVPDFSGIIQSEIDTLQEDMLKRVGA